MSFLTRYHSSSIMGIFYSKLMQYNWKGLRIVVHGNWWFYIDKKLGWERVEHLSDPDLAFIVSATQCHIIHLSIFVGGGGEDF